MASMVEQRYSHSLVSMKNKMIAVGNATRHLHLNSCELYDAVSKKFSLIKQPTRPFNFHLGDTVHNSAVSIGSKVVIFGKNSKTMAVYDVDNNEWSVKSCKCTENLEYFSCLKLPQFYTVHQ